MEKIIEPRSELCNLPYAMSDISAMFALSEREFDMKILHCYAGFSTFAAEMARLNYRVVASDPLYRHPIQTQKALFEQTKQEIIASNEVERQFLEQRQLGMTRFIEDFEQGIKEKRYTTDALPHLGFANEQFDLAIISHYLFTLSDPLSLQDHVNGIVELIRVADEVRIFPLVKQQGGLSPYIAEVVAVLQQQGLGVEIRGVPFELQKKGNAMLRVWAQSCTLPSHR